MRIGVPTEIKVNEYRVGLVPGSVRELTAKGHEVFVQSGAGAGIFADDNAYEYAGAKILPDAEAVFAQSEMIVKVKEPQKVEWERLRPDHILFTYLHLGPGCGAGQWSPGLGRNGHCVRNRHGRQRRSAAARTDE